MAAVGPVLHGRAAPVAAEVELKFIGVEGIVGAENFRPFSLNSAIHPL